MGIIQFTNSFLCLITLITYEEITLVGFKNKTDETEKFVKIFCEKSVLVPTREKCRMEAGLHFLRSISLRTTYAPICWMLRHRNILYLKTNLSMYVK